jgi:membrane associated rhomboid family serine protease
MPEQVFAEDGLAGIAHGHERDALTAQVLQFPRPVPMTCRMQGQGDIVAGIVAEFATVYRSVSRADCDERAFMLGAVAIPSVVSFDGESCLLLVEPGDAANARFHLDRYANELGAATSSLATTTPPPVRLHDNAWVGCLVYVLVLLGVAFAAGQGLWHVDDFNRGALDAALVRGGQWWRAWTALTLHLDAGHLVANLGGGAWFGYLAARQLGVGSAWFLVVTGAAAANLFDAGFGPPSYQSVGASTAVFTALGLMAAHSWRTGVHLPLRSARRWAPLVAGIALLGWLGTAGEGTDLVAHALGFIMGCVLGVLAAQRSIGRFLARVPQWPGGLLAIGSLAVAWACAMQG